MNETLLPSNATPIEVALDLAGDQAPKIDPALSYISGWKHIVQPPDLRPYLVQEFGMGVLQPFVETYAAILALRRPWCEVRGTHEAVHRGLAIVGYSGTLKDPPARRLAWAEFQIDLNRVRDEREDLFKIAGIVDLSTPVRSTFRRGVHGHDVPASEGCRTRLSSSILSNDSGARIGGKGPKWSFGRNYQFSHDLTEAELTAMGIWIPEIDGSRWADMHFPWVSATFNWSSDVEQARRVALAASLESLPCWFRFSDSLDQTIGYRKAVCRAVTQGLAGYAFGSDFLKPSLANPIGVHAFVRTGFGDGFGSEATSISLIIDADVTDQTKPGQLWLEPAGLTGGTEIAAQPVSIVFGETVREHVQFFLRF